MTENLTFAPRLTSADTLMPAGHVYLNCDTLATPAEMAAVGNACVWCHTVMNAKISGGAVAGTMIGQRAGASDEWTWSGPFCNACNKAHGRMLT